MKKFMLGVMIASVMVFGASVSVVAPAPLSAKAKTTGKSIKDLLKNAQVIKFNVEKPAQITLKIPLDIEAPKAGLEGSIGNLETFKATGNQRLLCVIYYSGHQQYTYQHTYMQPIQLNQPIVKQTIAVNFNDMPTDIAQKIDTYSCEILYEVDGGGYQEAIHFFHDYKFFSDMQAQIRGYIK
jgi:hypothetical protein